MFGGAHEACDLDRREEGGIQEEREEAGHRNGEDELGAYRVRGGGLFSVPVEK